jgi:beta-N-acetylhexosaminidase
MIKRLFLMVIALVFVATPLAAIKTSALSDKQKSLFQENINYFNVDACGPTATAAANTGGNNKIYVIGDSLTVGMRDSGNLKAKLTNGGWDVTDIEATGSINIDDSIPKLKADKNKVVSEAGTVIVGLGTNRTGDPGKSIDSMIDAITQTSPNAKIDWVNAYSTKADYTSFNKLLSDRASAGKIDKVLDWAKEAQDHAGDYNLSSDSLGIHTSPAGYIKRSEWVVKDLGPPPSSSGVSKLYIVGDSILVGAYFDNGAPLKKAIEDKHWSAQVDASGGRGMSYAGSDDRGTLPGKSKSGLDAITADAAAIKDSDTVVIQLGTNETNPPAGASKSAALFKAEMEKAISEVKAINSSATIYWVNIFSKTTPKFFPWINEYNQVIDSVASDKGINVLDTTKAGISLNGRTHPDTPGYTTLSKTIVDALGSSSSASPRAAAPATAHAASTASLTPEQKIAGTFNVGFTLGTSKDTIESVVKKYKIGGIFLLGNGDAASAGFDKSFFDKLNTDAGHTLVISSDEEGSSIHRYNYSFNFPTAGEMGKMSDSDVNNIGQKVGKALSDNGVNTDLAPVLDVAQNSNNSDAGTTNRAFGDSVDTVTKKAGAFAEGLKSGGVNPVYKHFPGLGSTSGNSDSGPVTSPSLSALKAKDLKTFDALANKNGGAVMMDNAHIPGLTGSGEVASTSSDAIKLLRGDYNFKGLVMTDDLSAKGMPGSVSSSVAAALKAGADMPLFTYSSDAGIDSAISAAKSAGVTTDDSLQRIADFLGSSISGSSTDALGCCPTDTTTQLTGNSDAEKVWNFFAEPSKGLSNTTIEAIMGNIQEESANTFSPTVYAVNHHSDTPEGAGSSAWGLAQWLPATKIYKIQSQSGVSGKVGDLVTQLNIIWWELSTNHSPSGGWDFKQFKSSGSLSEAVTYWAQHFEGAVNPNGSIQGLTQRQAYAITWKNKAAGSTSNAGVGSATDSTSSGSCSASTRSSSANGFTNPFPDGWQPNRLDMGYDGHFTKRIVSPCDGVISESYDSQGAKSWEGMYFVVKCSQKLPGLPTQSFFFAEGVTPTVNKGDQVTAGSQIGKPGPTGFHEGPGGIEWGMATDDVPRTAYAATLGNSCAKGSPSNVFVLDFAKWVEQNLGVAPPLSTDHAGCA